MQITTLQLWSAHVPALRQFYMRLLPASVEVASDDTLRLRIGSAQVIFKQAAAGWQGMYHYALLVPPQHLAAAKAYVAAHTPLIRDSAGGDQFAFESWGANAFYWYDPAGNIGEIIAHGASAPGDAPFSDQSLTGIAEAGVVADDVVTLAEQLRRTLGIATYRSASDDFIPLGDDDARLILVRNGRIWFPDTGIAAAPAPATIQLRRDDGALFRLRCTTSGVTVAQA
ncbi:MAG: hypothetical protein H7Y32_04890 [Chloroflexales bacterium]|nr:hypothetical protein [Chloroflexales bacterium]